METKNILNIQEASILVGLAPATLYSYVSARKIPFLKISKAVRFDRSELLTWLESFRVPAIGR